MSSEWILSIAYAFILGVLGEVAKNLVRAKPGDRGWRGVYFVTYKAHALFFGALGALPMHEAQVTIPSSFGGTSVVSYVLWGASCGAAAMVGYPSTVGIVKAWLKHKRAQVAGGAPLSAGDDA